MNKTLQNKLFKKYPNLAPDKNNQDPYGQYFIECGDGWYDILDLLFDRINYKIENPPWELTTTYKLKQFWNNLIPPILNIFPYKIYCRLIKYLQFDIKYQPPEINKLKNFRFAQVKQKFAGLRIYSNCSDKYIDGMISFAESMSYKICENCGTNQDVTTNPKGYMSTLCKKCRNKNK